MKKLYLIASLLLVSQVSFSQNKTIDLSTFDRLEIFGPFKVNLVKSERAYAEIDFNGIEQEDIVCEVEKGSLKLKLKNRHYINDWKEGKNSKYVIVNLYFKDIDVIEASAGAIVKSAEQLKSKYLIVDCSMGAEVRLNVFAQKIEAIASMGGELEMKGQTDHLEVKATMGAVLDAYELYSKTIYVRANMGAEVNVHATEEIEASAGFGASIDYTGQPAVRHTSRNFGGEVNRKRD